MDRTVIITYAVHEQMDNYAALASFSVLLYDYCLTFSMEVEHMWSPHWSMAKLLFFATRYSAFIDTLLTFHGVIPSLSITTCTVVYTYTCSSFFIGIAVADAIITRRTLAIWGYTRCWTLGLSGLYLSKWILGLIIVAYYLTSVTFGPLPDPAIAGCFSTSGSNIIFSVFLILALSELLIFILTAVKGIYHPRSNNQLLLSTLYRDGLRFSMILAIVAIVNVVLLMDVDTGLRGTDTLMLTPQRVMHSILSGRIILHLRQTNARDATDEIVVHDAV